MKFLLLINSVSPAVVRSVKFLSVHTEIMVQQVTLCINYELFFLAVGNPQLFVDVVIKFLLLSF